jgi:hypothetical protein
VLDLSMRTIIQPSAALVNFMAGLGNLLANTIFCILGRGSETARLLGFIA